MVIITTLVAKVYFPASLERGAIPNIRRKYAYRRRPTMEEEEHSDAEDDDELEALYSDEDDDENDNNNAEEEAEEEDRALEYEQDEEPLVADRTGRRRTTGSGTSRAAAATTRPLEFDQVHTSQTQVLQRLVLCCLMLQATFVTWGALQERMLTRRYPRHTGDYFTYS